MAAGRQFEDWSKTYRMYSNEHIDLKQLFSPAIEGVKERLNDDEPMVVIMDDTLIRKRGLKVAGTGWRRDPLGPHFQTNLIWAQRFLQLSVALPDRVVSGRSRAIPVDFIHAPTPKKPRKNASDEEWQEYRDEQSRTALSAIAAQRLKEFRLQVPDKQLICAVDGGYTNSTMFRSIPEDAVLIGRIRKDAKLYGLPQNDSIRKGRRKFYGDPLPTPEQIRQDESIPWQKITAFAADKHHEFEIKTVAPIRWRGSGERDVRIVVIRPLAYRNSRKSKLLYRNPVYLICSDTELPLDKLLQAYIWRWEIEVNFRDEKTVLGVGEAQVRRETSVQNAPALLVASFSFLSLAADSAFHNCFPSPKWYPRKPTDRPSIQQLLALFRSQLWKSAIDTNKMHFVSRSSSPRTPFFSATPLTSAICYATK